MDRLRASSARELRCALFALKQNFQQDKEVVHEFIASHGIDCLISVAKAAEVQYVNYVVRAVGQIMLYVDGMNGIIEHKTCIQWLYSLVSFGYRGVPKTALKLLLVFLEYAASNCLLLIKAINEVDKERGPWSTVVDLLHYSEGVDSENQVYAMTLINKCLNSLTDQNMYYDQTDALEKQNISGIIEKHASLHDANVDLLLQFRLYEAVLSNEDGEEVGSALRKLDETISQSKISESVNNNNAKSKINGHSSSQSSNESDNNNNTNTVHNRRKMRMLRQKSFMIEQEKKCTTENGHKEEDKTSDTNSVLNGNSVENGTHIYTSGLQQRIQNGTLGHTTDRQDMFFVINTMQGSNNEAATPVEKDKALLMKREGTVRDLAQKLSSNNICAPARTADDKFPRVGDTSGIISKAMKCLSESNSKTLSKYSVNDIPVTNENSDINFEDDVLCLHKDLKICDLDFTDLQNDDTDDIFNGNNMINGVPPPPPLAMFPLGNVPPLPPTHIPPPLPYCCPLPLSGSVTSSTSNSLENDATTKQNDISAKKTKKTMKLFWKEIVDKPASDVIHEKAGGFIWDEIKGVELDTALIEHLFESRTKEISKEKFYETTPKKELSVLEHKRSQAINIVKAKLPTPRSIIAAILKMDSTVITRESIDKLLGMLPTEEETSTILEAQRLNPNVPLASAETFLMILSGIPALSARLKVWVFKMDFEYLQKEIAEPLMDLKLSLELLRTNKTFKCVLGTIKSIGEFLNGSSTKGFQIEYLAKVAEVKDTVHKNSLLHHLCQIVLENYPESTDLFSEIGPVIRASKEDFDRLKINIEKLATDCIASREHLWQIAKHDGPQVMESKLADFLKECMQNILVLRRINEVLHQRFRKFLLYIGTPLSEVKRKTPNETLKIIADFSLEYRTARERVIIQKEKKENHKERKKTLGKMITEVAHTDLQKVIQADQNSSLSLVRNNLDINGGKGDELIESLARIIAHPPSPRQCQRRTRLTDRKSLRRTLTGSSKDKGY